MYKVKDSIYAARLDETLLAKLEELSYSLGWSKSEIIGMLIENADNMLPVNPNMTPKQRLLFALHRWRPNLSLDQYLEEIECPKTLLAHLLATVEGATNREGSTSQRARMQLKWLLDNYGGQEP